MTTTVSATSPQAMLSYDSRLRPGGDEREWRRRSSAASPLQSPLPSPRHSPAPSPRLSPRPSPRPSRGPSPGPSSLLIPPSRRNSVVPDNLDRRLQKVGFANKLASDGDHFFTPDNQEFYSRRKCPYMSLDPGGQEIRLLQVSLRERRSRYGSDDNRPDPRRSVPLVSRDHLSVDDITSRTSSSEARTPSRRSPSPSQRAREGRYQPRSRGSVARHGRDGSAQRERRYSRSPGRHNEFGSRDSQGYSSPSDEPYSPRWEETRESGYDAEEGAARDADEDMLLECTLLDQVSLPSVAGTYCAISYCAGSPHEVAPMLVDGVRFNAFATLEHAIRCVLRQWSVRYPGKKLLIWADQICIDQHNHAERTAQVGMMREIYRRSNETYVCLSSPAVDNCLRWIPPEEINKPSASKEQSPHPAVMKLQNSLRASILALDEGAEELPRWLQSVQSFITSPWWCRSWVYQEFIASPRPFFLSGRDCVDWATLAPLVDFICEGIEPFLTTMFHDVVSQERIEAEEMQQQDLEVRKYTKMRDSLSRELRSLDQKLKEVATAIDETWTINISGYNRRVEQEEQLVAERDATKKELKAAESRLRAAGRARPAGWREVERRIELLQRTLHGMDTNAVTSILRSKGVLFKPADLQTVLQHSRNCHASDPRDRVYAFLGLAHKEYGIVPDYDPKNTVCHALILAAQHIIRYEGGLDVLRYVHRGRQELGAMLPTWVPDWTSKEDECSLERFIDMKRRTTRNNHPFRASKGLDFTYGFRVWRRGDLKVDLEVGGVMFDPLDRLDGPIEGFPTLQAFQLPSSRIVIAPRSAVIGDEVWILAGASKPVVLRPEKDGNFSFLGEALIIKTNGSFSDMMFGRLQRFSDDPRYRKKDIWLV